MAWTDERVERLKKLWAEGWSASQIARELGEVTRNAVIGKVHRLGIARRETSAQPSRPPSRTAAPKRTSTPSRPRTRAKPAVRPTPREQAPAREAPPTSVPTRFEVYERGKPVSLLELTERTCKWPIGHPGEEDFSFCGAPAETGTPYCAYHLQRAYQAAPSKRDKDRERHRQNEQRGHALPRS